MLLWNAEGVWRAIAVRSHGRRTPKAAVYSRMRPLHPHASPGAQSRTGRILQQLLERAGKRLRIPGRSRDAGLPFQDVFRRTT